MPSSANQPSVKSRLPNSSSRDVLSNVPLTAMLFWLPIIGAFRERIFSNWTRLENGRLGRGLGDHGRLMRS